MPNHVKNKIELNGDINVVGQLIEQFCTPVEAYLNKTDSGEFVICRKPGDGCEFCWLDLKTGHCHNRTGLNQIGLPADYEPEIEQGFLHFPDFTKVIAPPDNDAYNDRPTQQAVRHDPDNWYNWNTKHWGTKWNSYSCKRAAINIFYFDTAWRPVPAIIEKMSLAFPGVTIKYTWADEDTSHNCGRAVYLNGLITRETPEGGTKDAYDIAFEMRPHYKDDYELVDGKYKYKEK